MMARGAEFENLCFNIDGWNGGVGEPQMRVVLEALAPHAPFRGLRLGGDFLLSKTTCEAVAALRPATLTFYPTASPDLRGAPRDAHVYWTAEMLRGVLPGLKQLAVYSLTHMPGVVLQALGNASPALEVVFVMPEDEQRGGTLDDVASMLHVMSTLPQLKELILEGGPSSSWPVPSAVLDLGRPSSLTRLTSLTLGTWSHGGELAWRWHELTPELRAQFREAAERERGGLMAAVQAMPSLQSLSVNMPLRVSDLERLTSLTKLDVSTLQAPVLGAAGGGEALGNRSPPRFKVPPKLAQLDLAHVSPSVLGSLVALPGQCRVYGHSNHLCLRFSPLEYSVAAEEGDFLDPSPTNARVRASAAAAVASAVSFLCGAALPLVGLEVQAPAVGGGMLLPPAAEPGAVAGAAGSVPGGHAGWLAALGAAPLSHLALKRVALDAMDLMALVQHCPGLTTVDLKDCAVSPAALPCLLGLPELTWLGVRLSPSDAQDVILASLAQLALSPSSLETMDVVAAEANGPWEAWVDWLEGLVARLRAEATARGLVRIIQVA